SYDLTFCSRSCHTSLSPTRHHPPSLHDALPIFPATTSQGSGKFCLKLRIVSAMNATSPSSGFLSVQSNPVTSLSVEVKNLCRPQDRKSTRLNSSHVKSSYAVFCLKQKNRIQIGR